MFKDELGKVQGTTAKFIFPTRPVPYALRVKVERELECAMVLSNQYISVIGLHQ